MEFESEFIIPILVIILLAIRIFKGGDGDDSAADLHPMNGSHEEWFDFYFIKTRAGKDLEYEDPSDDPR